MFLETVTCSQLFHISHFNSKLCILSVWMLIIFYRQFQTRVMSSWKIILLFFYVYNLYNRMHTFEGDGPPLIQMNELPVSGSHTCVNSRWRNRPLPGTYQDTPGSLPTTDPSPKETISTGEFCFVHCCICQTCPCWVHLFSSVSHSSLMSIL